MSNSKTSANDAAPEGAAGKGGKKNKTPKSGTKFILLMIILGTLAPFIAPTLLVGLGLLPTLVALFTDTDPRHSGLTTIGFLNLAGVVPFIVELWEKGQTMDAAFGIIRQPMNWLIMFGAAGVGQLILYVVPLAVTMLAVVRTERRMAVLKEGLKQLDGIWGPDVATSKPVDTIRSGE
jgi:hypothetical protein